MYSVGQEGREGGKKRGKTEDKEEVCDFEMLKRSRGGRRERLAAEAN